MKLLLELTRIANLKRIAKIDVFEGASLRNKTSKFNQLYEGLVHDQFRSDREAAKKLYKTDPGDDRYRQLKSRFRKRLLNTLFFINVNPSAKAGYEQIYLDGQRDWALVNILQMYRADLTVPWLARQIQTTALKHHFTDLIVETASLLRLRAARDGDRKSFDKYDELLTTYLPIRQAEQEADGMIQTMEVRMAQPDDRIQAAEWKVWTDRLIALSERFPSPHIQFVSYVVAASHYIDEERWGLAAEICHQAERIMAGSPDHFSGGQRYRIQVLLMRIFLHTGAFEEARAQSVVALELLNTGSQEWFDYLNLYFLLALHSGHHTIALAILQQVMQRKEFVDLDSGQKHTWGLYRAMLNYLLQDQPESRRLRQARVLSQFQVREFMEDPALFPKEQRILSVWMLIIQLLYAMDQRNHDLAGEIIFRLKQYTRRQLHPDRQARTIEFIRCLSQLSKGEFQAGKVRFANKYYHRLLAVPFRLEQQPDTLEIIPFHTLWTHIHERLKGPAVALASS